MNYPFKLKPLLFGLQTESAWGGWGFLKKPVLKLLVTVCSAGARRAFACFTAQLGWVCDQQKEREAVNNTEGGGAST